MKAFRPITKVLAPPAAPLRTVSPEDAAQSGFWPLTVSYDLTQRWEKRWLHAVIDDQIRAGCSVLLVGDPDSPEIWRDGVQLTDKTVRRIGYASERHSPYLSRWRKD